MNDFHHTDFKGKGRGFEDTFVENRKLVLLCLLLLLFLTCLADDQTGNATSCFANGNKSRVFVTLKNVWNTEIWKELILLWAISGRIMEMIYIPIPNTTAPKLLKVRWITDARFAFRLVPALDKGSQTGSDILSKSNINRGICGYHSAHRQSL